MTWGFDFDSLTDVFKTDGEVSYWKVLGGAAAGVAGVVALPVFGGVGAVTAVGAAVGSAVGGLAGVAASYADDSEKKAEKRGESRGRAAATAAYQAKVTKLEAALREAISKRKSDKGFFDLIVGLYAVGMACAACDGTVAEVERRDIEEFIGGIAVAKMPPNVRKKLEMITNNPPNVETAFATVQELGLDDWALFDEVIDMVIKSDGRTRREEITFRSQWKKLKIAA